MAYSSIQPIEIIDDEDAILIDDEREDEGEILEYVTTNHLQSPSISILSSRSPCPIDPESNHQQRATSALVNQPTTSSQHLLSRPRSSSPRPSSMPQVIRCGPSIANSELNASARPLDTGDSGSKYSVDLHLPQMIHESQSCANDDLNLHARVLRHSPDTSTSGGTTIEPGTLIDLDELENIESLWHDEPDLQILHVQKRTPSQPVRRQSDVPIPKRNLTIEAPLFRLPEWQHKNLRLRPSKTVELHDGDFLMITDVIQHSNSGEVTLRGHKLQRCRSMNGLLEKKLNEVCFFHEVDLDDARPLPEQSVVEVCLDNVKGLRILRKTNQMFPLCRSLTLGDFWSQEDAATQGGLTVRWKYTCTYSSETDRWNNNPTARSIEFLREDECMKDSGTLDEMRRFDWRGDTIPGGAFRPEIEGKQLLEGVRTESVISLASSNTEPDLDHTIIDSPPTSIEAGSSGKRQAPSISSSLPMSSRNPRASFLDVEELSRKNWKRPRLDNGEELEIARRDLSGLSVDIRPSALRDEDVVDLTDSYLSSQSHQMSSIQTNLNSRSPLKHEAATKILPTIDISASDLAAPPRTGSISCRPISTNGPVIRSAGQMLTYGDAFCGCGGTTRGAVMAGLRVKWGFDYWDHACSTWRANFPQATCYQLASQEFVRKAQGEKWRKPVDVKVDVLHLSPPCQYFSPAHTVDCSKDEFNVAGLYAVDAVIKVAKPRVVTLEQTFGLVAVRHRKYFNSLIHMFTSLGFSVRWSIVPLAQWGLPQRRHRLIIIAACPGEILPELPSPTHSDEDRTLPDFATVNHALSQIPDDALDHDLSSLDDKNFQPWDGDAILPRSMTTSGGQNYHPSGKRDFTLREYAVLQGFPPNHLFTAPSIKKQIGNAVPPCAAKVLFESIKKQLDDSDGVLKERETMVID